MREKEKERWRKVGDVRVLTMMRKIEVKVRQRGRERGGGKRGEGMER